MDMHVDQPWANDFAAGIELAIGLSLECRADAEHAIVLDPEIRDLIDPLHRIDDPAIDDTKNAHDGPT